MLSFDEKNGTILDVRTNVTVGFPKAWTPHRLLVTRRSCCLCGTNRLRGNDSDVAEWAADGSVRNDARRPAIHPYRRTDWLPRWFALGRRVLGSSDSEKIPSARHRLDSRNSFVASGGAVFHSLRSLGGVYSTSCRSGGRDGRRIPRRRDLARWAGEEEAVKIQ